MAHLQRAVPKGTLACEIAVEEVRKPWKARHLRAVKLTIAKGEPTRWEPVEVAAYGLNDQVRAEFLELRRAPQGAGPDLRARGQIGEPLADNRVPRIFTGRDSG